ncbi:MAG: sialidase family protein [candidate division WOR-3 bacterium]
MDIIKLLIFGVLIKDTLVKNPYQIKEKLNNFFTLKEKSEREIEFTLIFKKDIENFILLAEKDIKRKFIFKELKMKIEFKMNPLSPQKTEIILNSEAEVFGWYDKVFIPPTYLKRESKGIIERKILDYLKEKENFDIKYENENSLNIFSLPFDQNIDIIKPPDNKNQNETTISINKNKIVCGWNDYRGYPGYVTVGTTYSHNGGITFGNNLFPARGLMADSNQGDPVIDFGNGDTVFFTFISFNRGSFTGDLGFCRSFDGGKTWETPINLTNTPFDLDDKPWMSVYGDTIFIVWDVISSTYGVYLMKSTDGGNSFSSPLYLTSSGMAPIPRKGRGDTIYVLWTYDSPQNPAYDYGIWLIKSVDGGNTFGSPIHVADYYYNSILPWRDYVLPSFDVDRKNGNLYVVYHSSDPSHTQFDVYFTRSIDGGQSFSVPQRLNLNTVRSQFFPSVSVDDSGYVHVVWYDTRKSIDSLELYYRVSKDFGLNFSNEIKVTDRARKPYRQNFIGDYIEVCTKDYIVGTDFCHSDINYTSDDIWFARLKRDKTPPQVSVIFPNGEETFYAGDTIYVKYSLYDNSGISLINFHYSIDGGNSFIKIDSIFHFDTLFEWIIPDTTSNNVLFRVDAKDYVWNSSFDTSDGPFSIIKLNTSEKYKTEKENLRIPTIVSDISGYNSFKFLLFDYSGRKSTIKNLKRGIYFVKFKNRIYKQVYINK